MLRGRSATILVAASLLICAACFGSDDNLTDTGLGKPLLTAEFPHSVEAGSTHPLELTVENPGPGNIDTLVIAFSLVGPSQGQRELPAPLVATGVEGESPSVVSVEPSPKGVSQDTVIYTFEGIDEGEESTYTFEVKAPGDPGVAANSVQVYDGQEIDRAAGVRVETTVER